MNLHFFGSDTFPIVCNNTIVAQYQSIELYLCEETGVSDIECDEDNPGEKISETCKHCNEWVMCSNEGEDCIFPNTSPCSYCGNFYHADEEHECDAAPSFGNKTCEICVFINKIHNAPI